MAQDLFSQLAQKTLAELSPASQAPQEAVDDPVSAIYQVAQERGIDPAHLLGLAKLETQAGRKTVKGDGADTRNLFNVKDFSKGGTGIRARDGAEGSNDRYRAYGSYRESVEDLAGLLERRYPGAAKAGSPEEFARELKRGGYATDPAYERKLASTIRSSGGASRPVEQPQEWDQGARYAPVGLAPRSVEDSKPAEKPSKRAGFWEGAADVGLSTAQGVVGSVKALTDLAGADNAASRGLDDASKGLEKFKSDASQQDRQYHQQKIKEAEASGDWKDEVAAYANMVWDMPLESLAQGVGSFATLGAGKVAQMAKLANAAKKAGVAKEAFLKTAQGIEAAKKAGDLGMKVNVGLGVGQGIGGVKGSQYEQTFNAAKESGLSDQQAQTLATEAQSYQQGWGQQALGAGLGYVAGKTGPIEKLAAGKTVGAGGVARRFVGGGLVEAGTEGLQGGQERYAGNAAAIDAGVLDESRRWAGVAGSGASEAITAGVLGGGAGALGRPDVDPQAQARAAAQQSGGIVSRAGLAATPGAQQPNPAATQPTAAAAPGAPGQSAAGTAAGSAAAAAPTGNAAAAASPAQPAQTPIQASAMSAIEQALEADKQRRRTAGEVVEDEVEEVDVVAAGDPAAVDPPEVSTPPVMQVQPIQPAQPASAGFSSPKFDNSPIPKMDPAAADEQRRQFAEFEQKRKNRRAGTRAATWNRNPFLGFLGANGINRDTAGEFAPGLTERRKAFVPGYGPVFRTGAKNLDELVQTAKEDGFLSEDQDENDLYDLIDRALRGERIAPLYADGAAEAEGQRRQQVMQEREGATFEDYLAQQANPESDNFDPLASIGAAGYDFGDDDLADYATAQPGLQTEVAALAQHYYDLGFDSDDVLERLSVEAENQPEQAYYDLAKSRFTQLIEQALNPGRPEGSAKQGGGGAVRLDTGPQGDAQADGGAAGSQGQAAAVTPPAATAAANPRRADAIRAKLDGLKAQGFSQFTRSGGRTLLINPGTYETVELTPAEMAVAKAASGQARAGLQSLRGQRNPAQVDQQGVDVLQSYTPADMLAQDEQAQAARAQQAAEQQAAAAKAKADDERRRIEQASYAAADSFELGQSPLDSLTGQQDIFGAAPVTQPAPLVATTGEGVGAPLPPQAAPIKVGDKVRIKDEGDDLHTVDSIGDNGYVNLSNGFGFPAGKASKYLSKVEASTEQSPQAAPIAQDLAGEKINDEWTAFDPQSGTLGIPRAEMPQIKAEHRGAMINFLKARGIDGQQESIPSAAIKPTQAEFSPGKVKKAIDRQGGNRSIIVSADGYVVDGHHQWLAAREKGEPIQAIRLDQNIGDVLAALKDMPSAQAEQALPDRELESGPAAVPPPEFASFEAKKALLELSPELASAEGGLNERGNALARTPWGGLSESDRALALKLSQDKQASNDASNARVREGMRQIRRRQLQNERTITQANGKPFKTEAGAKAMLDEFDLSDTHKIVSEGGGYALRQMPLAEQAEVRRKAEGRESYMEAQAAVIAEMGIPSTADGEIDATDEQWDEIDQRIAERLGRRPVAGNQPRPAASSSGGNQNQDGTDSVVRSKNGYAEVKLNGKKHFVTPNENEFNIRDATGVRVFDEARRPLTFKTEAEAIQYAADNAKRNAPPNTAGQRASEQSAATPVQQDSQTAAGQQWDGMTSIDREAVALRAKMPKAAAAMWSKRGWDAIDPVIQEKLGKAMQGGRSQAGNGDANADQGLVQPSQASLPPGITIRANLQPGSFLVAKDGKAIGGFDLIPGQTPRLSGRYGDAFLEEVQAAANYRAAQEDQKPANLLASSNAIPTKGMTQAEAQQALEAGQKLLHYDEEIWIDRAKTDAVDSYVIKSRYTDLPVVSTKGPAGPRGTQWGKSEAAKRAVESMGLPQERTPAAPVLEAGLEVDRLTELKRDLVELRQRIKDQGQISDDRLIERERKLNDLVNELERDIQKAKLDQIPPAAVSDEARGKAFEAGQATASRIIGWASSASGVARVKTAITDSLMAQGYFDDGVITLTRQIVEELRQRDAQAQSQPAGREGYDTPVELDSAQLKTVLEQTRGEPLVDKPAKLEAWRNGTAKTDPAKFPVELVFRPDGKLDVNDGRHRIALAAERGEKVTAFIDGKDAKRAEDLLAGAQVKSQQKYDHGDFGFMTRSEAEAKHALFLKLARDSRQRAKAAPTKFLKNIEEESASKSTILARQLKTEINYRMRQFPDYRGEDEQTRQEGQIDPDLEAIFDQLDGITQRTQASGQQAAATHPRAERIQLVQKHILDILEDLEDSGKVTINC